MACFVVEICFARFALGIQWLRCDLNSRDMDEPSQSSSSSSELEDTSLGHKGFEHNSDTGLQKQPCASRGSEKADKSEGGDGAETNNSDNDAKNMKHGDTRDNDNSEDKSESISTTEKEVNSERKTEEIAKDFLCALPRDIIENAILSKYIIFLK